MSKQKVDHSARSHAYLSASGASRWMGCTPSAELESHFPEESNFYAQEGTLAHEFAELNLKRDLNILTEKEHAEAVAPFMLDEMYSKEMEDFVQVYVDYVVQQFTQAKRKTKAAEILIEEKVDFSEFVSGGFGTTDTCIVADGVLEVIDYKHGMGVRVSSEENPQLKLYGLGALNTAEILYDIHTVRLTIVQPRLDSISVWEVHAEDLKEWGHNVVVPAAEKAFIGEGEAVPGDWCKFCKAIPKCKAFADMSLKLAITEFTENDRDPRLMSDEQVLEHYSKIPQVKLWEKALSEYVSKQAIVEGKKWDGYKVVQGRANRKWTSEADVVKKLKQNKYKQNEYFAPRKLSSIPAIEKLLGKIDFENLMSGFVNKPEGAPSLVLQSDKRKEYFPASAADDFAEQ